ncbi:nocobactin polyketide synthase NbtC [Nocardia sp. BMG111209]|uniref:nocobactin polyketide synthase NbtC n=1 Tax=Nocardia sp. BMG111209 TaxID=1160137 RepID=UPI00035F92E5|nr:nocobactin polyketide synthase NbtC [Nocardia sp. BMG111209]
MSEYRLPDGTVPVLLSSDTAEGLRTEATRLAAYLAGHPEVSPDAMADMLFRTRVARRHRALAMAGSRDELAGALAAVAAGAEHPTVVTGVAAARRIAFVFPGQGSQRPGMGRPYYDLSEAYRAEVDHCAEIHLDRYGHAQPLHYLLGADGRYQDTVWEVQPALMFHMSGLAAMWQAAGVRPAAAVGHSQGELAAASIAGVVTRRDAVLAVTHRARLVERISPRGYSMAVLGMDREDCEALLARNSGWAELSVVNSPSILAISGDRDTILEMVAAAGAAGRFAREIRVAYPAHTSIVAELRPDFEAFLGDEMSSRHFYDGEIPCYGATLGEAITTGLEQERYWYWNLRNRVRFDRAVVAAAVGGADTFIEVAEHPTLQLAVQENLTLVPQDPALPPRDFRVFGTSLRTAESLGDFTRNLAAVAVHDSGYRWQALRTGGSVRLPLRDFPNTVMNPQRLWAAAGTTAAEPVTRAARPWPLRLAEQWVRLERRSLVAPRALLVVDHTGTHAALADALCAAADRYGAGAQQVSDATAAGDYDTVLVLAPELPDLDGPDAIEAVADFFGADWLPDLTGVRDCWLVTVGGETVEDTDPAPHQVHGALPAGFRCIGMEHLSIAFRHLDLAAGQADPAAAIVRAVHVKDEPELALRGSGIYAKRLVPDRAETAGLGETGTAVAGEPSPDEAASGAASETADGTTVSAGRETGSVGPESAAASGATDLDHVVIVGGTGTLGMVFTEHYAQAGAGRITLLSRSGETPQITRRLRGVRRSGTEIVVAACDVTDRAAVAELAVALADRPASLIVHSAVNYVRAELADVTAEKAREMAGSKIYGTDAVLRHVPRTADCRIVLCSSAAATFGGRGQVLYATVNRMLDVLAQRLRADGVDAVAVQWGLWDLEGPLHAVGVAPVEAAGVVAMAPEQALAVGLTTHADRPGAGNRLVAAANWAEVRAVISAIGAGPLLELIPAEPVAEPEPEPVAAEPEPAAAPAPEAEQPPATRLSDQLRRELGAVMGTGGDTLDSSLPLVALGLDSLQALDFRKRVQARLHRDLPVAAILGGASLDDVLRLLASAS